VQSLLLGHAAPMDIAATLAFLGRRPIPGVETYEDGCYTRTFCAAGGPARVVVSPAGAGGAPSSAAGGSREAVSATGGGGVGGAASSAAGGGAEAVAAAGGGGVACDVELADPGDLAAVTAQVRRLLDLDADPGAVGARLGGDPALGALVAARPGLRAPGAIDGFELAIRAVVGQQISVGGASTVLGRIAAEHGSRAFDGVLFPAAERLAAIDPATLPMPRARGRTVVAIAEACASGELRLHPGADRAREHAALLALPGVGPWTADYIRMRALGDHDVLLATDLGVRRSAARLGLDLGGGRPEWAPWRSYATHHLWAAGH
jgi:AraC family transcriptional regulator of adaptative response / DNA-3-methyladenine glycosylase II